MNDELKAKWLEALRSGQYQQTKARLRRDDSYCCLGVLCDIVDPTGWDDDHFGGYRYEHRGDGGVGVLPYSLRRELRLDTDVVNACAAKNDAGHSFAEIADFIERTA